MDIECIMSDAPKYDIGDMLIITGSSDVYLIEHRSDYKYHYKNLTNGMTYTNTIFYIDSNTKFIKVG